ncbi:CaaX prenyl protease Ste24 [Beauveria brongniartii RCEF 3172]|uniref:CaaX prenyl protease Ste24 n=1 Tax=Beauveria brongniartii RCEF 3172 TaxID=1081107 RepID=A0A166XUI0_9HYPO|nr:CaaX prenyl protease Ste24 [Beauveria brongniartii RCEF 3172]
MTSILPWKALVLLISLCHFVFESWLTLRQLRILARPPSVPSVLADKLDRDTVTNSQSYKHAKAKLSLATGLWGQLINVAIIYLDALPWLWDAVGGLTPALASNTSRSIVFTLCYMWFYNCAYLPCQVYSTFVVEAAFGFNRQTPGLFVRDFLKIQTLNSLLLAPSLALFLAIVARTGSNFALYVWLGAAGIQALIVTLNPVLFTPLFTSLRPLADDSLLPKRVYVSDDSKRSAHSNAYFYGFPWQMQIVVQDTLLHKASADEITAVNLFIISLSFAAFAGRPDLYRSFGFRADEAPVVAGFLLFYKVLAPVNSVLQLLHNAVCRGYEFTADRFAKDAGQGSELASALIKLQAQNLGAVQNDALTRPALLNSWEGLYFDYNETTIARLAQPTAELGVRMFVLDDGWFGDKYPRVSDNAGLGDWVPNPAQFPSGFDKLINITHLKLGNSSQDLKIGLRFEPEMVNPNSTLYVEHLDWAMHAGDYPRALMRNQLVLNLALPKVQNNIVDAVSKSLKSGAISYVKWDNNRGIHEMPHPLTTAFPDIIWEGYASGGARFDPGILQHFPQVWTSDDTDAVERITIQMGTSLVYPPSATAAHVVAVPNGLTQRATSLSFRAHVAMMAGFFGF